jgi:microcystin-dependent protein
MAKTKISEFSATAADNTDITNINIAEGCSPANVNNSIRSLMALLKDQQTGTSGDPFTVSGALTASGTLTSSGTIDITGGFKLDGSAGTSGQVLLSAGSNTPTWGNAFVAGMIMMWSGTIATIPSGWLLCNGSNSTPDLRNRFIVGAFSDTAGVAYTTITGANTQTGGSKDAIVVSHTHTLTDPGHNHTTSVANQGAVNGSVSGGGSIAVPTTTAITSSTSTTGITVTTAGSSGTDQNLPPYYALAFIMKS